MVYCYSKILNARQIARFERQRSRRAALAEN
jgi:hypothetical protein